MKILKLIFPITILSITSPLLPAPQPFGPLNFGGGLNLQKTQTDIDDNQSCDMCNIVSNQDGSAQKIFGTMRFINQARSTAPVSGLYRAYASTGTSVKKVTVAVMGTDILISTDDSNRAWIVMSSFVTPGQHWSFTTMRGKVIMTGDGLVDPVYTFDIFTATLTQLFAANVSSESVLIRSKYLLQKNNYLMFINCADVTNGTTYYPSRVYFSMLTQLSSVTYNRFFDVKTNDGEELVGGGVSFDKVDLFKNSSIHELSFTILDLLSRGGDQSLQEIVRGFGLKAPRSLQTDGVYYIMASQDAIRLWDGGRRARITTFEETKSIDIDIRPLFERLKKAGTYEKMVGKFYKKRLWYILSYEDPSKFPKGVNNSVIIYDFKNGQWYPICGWLADTFETFDGLGDKGDLIYGDSQDGTVYYADLETAVDNAVKNVVLDTMDSSSTWRGPSDLSFNRDLVNVREGTGSLRMWINTTVTESSMTLMKVFPLGLWNDKTPATKDDKISFNIFVTTLENVSSLRLDLEVNDAASPAFDTNFTSVTFTSNTLLNMGTTNIGWNTISISLSSFPVRPDWTALDSEIIPFANTPNYYGIRFVLNGVAVSSVSIDDVRFVQSFNPVNFYRFTKLFNFGSVAYKTIGQILLTMEKPSDSSFKMDVYNDFGKVINTVSFDADIPKEIIVMGLVSTASISIMDESDFSIKQSTIFAESNYLPLNGVAAKNFIYFADRTNDRYVKMKRDQFGVIDSTYGSFGSGNTNYNLIHQSDINEKGSIYQVDMYNQRIKEHSQNDLSFIRAVGSLGTSATSYHQPTGITCTDEIVTVSDEGNNRLTQLSVSTLGVILQKIVDQNTIGDSSLDQDSDYYYMAFNRINETSNLYQDVILEKRFRGNMDLVTRVRITPEFSTILTTAALEGDIALLGRYIFISITDNSLSTNPKFYIQKRLKSDFSLVKEFSPSRETFSILGDALAHKPSIKNEAKDLKSSDGKYLQIKFYDEDKDNFVRIINQTFLIDPQSIKY